MEGTHTRRPSAPLRYRSLLVVSIAALAPLLAACSSGGSDSGGGTTGPPTTASKEFTGYVRTPPLDVSAVTMPAADGTPASMAARRNGLRLVYFGYTFCPDVCPTTMTYVKKALSSIPAKDRDRVEVDMVTIDPARDTAEKLQTYIQAFVPNGRALRTDDPDALRRAAEAFGANYRVTTGTDGEEEVSHSGDLYAVDDAGTVVLAWPFGTTPSAIEHDLVRLLRGERPTPA